MPKTTGLSKKQRGFKNDVIAGKEPTQAVLDNYDVTNIATASVMANQLLKNSNVAAEIKSASQKAADEAGATTRWIAERRKALFLRCACLVPELGPDGNETGRYFSSPDAYHKLDSAGANAALNGLAKMQGCDTEKIEHSGDPDTFGIKIILNPGKK